MRLFENEAISPNSVPHCISTKFAFQMAKTNFLTSAEQYNNWSLLAPIHMKGSPKSKLGQVGVGSNITQNHSSSPQEVISVHVGVSSNIAESQSSGPQEVISGNYWPQCTCKVNQNRNQVKPESFRTLPRITRVAHREPYLVPIHARR